MTAFETFLELTKAEWLDRIHLNWEKLFQISNKVLSQFSSIFTKETGTVKNDKATLILKPGAKPRYFAPKHSLFSESSGGSGDPETRRSKVMGESNIFRLGYTIGNSSQEWWGVRLCDDYKVTVNPSLQVTQHPLPNVQDMLAALGQ